MPMPVAWQIVAVCSRRSRCSCTSHRTVCQQPAVSLFLSQPPFLADRTNGRAIGTVLRLSVGRLSVTLCIVA